MTSLDGVNINEAWLRDDGLQTLFDLIENNGGEVRVAGGAIRNTLMGKPTTDIDLSTTLLPQEVVAIVQEAGHKAIPTGIEHGTVTVVVKGQAFEITTLREDIETDGRHAVVRFGSDWQADAQRRDLTINGMFCDRNGLVYDYVGGFSDVQNGLVRFIGDAGTRIREDALRILRFFRFFAWYGEGRPDANGLKACNANKKFLSSLSAERIWMELRKLLGAPDPGRALLWMRTTGILNAILPESEKWGIDGIPGLVRLEQEQGWEPDYLLRLMAIIRPHEETVNGISDRLKLSKAERLRLVHWAHSIAPNSETDERKLDPILYQGNVQGMQDALRIEAIHLLNRNEAYGSEKMVHLADYAQNWVKPDFPVKGKDLIKLGEEPGKEVGEQLKVLENHWIESGFTLTRSELLKLAANPTGD